MDIDAQVQAMAQEFAAQRAILGDRAVQLATVNVQLKAELDAAMVAIASAPSETAPPVPSPDWFLQTVAGEAFTREELRAEAKAMLAKNAAPQVEQVEADGLDFPAPKAPTPNRADDLPVDLEHHPADFAEAVEMLRRTRKLVSDLQVSLDAERDLSGTYERGERS